MANTINALNYDEWAAYGLADYGDFSDGITECNMWEDSFSGHGEWWFAAEEPLPNGDYVIYFGSWGNDNSPGASMYTHAEMFESKEEFDARVKDWENQPEWIGEDL